MRPISLQVYSQTFAERVIASSMDSMKKRYQNGINDTTGKARFFVKFCTRSCETLAWLFLDRTKRNLLD